MKTFRERRPIPIGIISIALVIALVVVAFNAADLPIIGGGAKYTAAFRDASGLTKDDEVRVAGVRVGKVTSIALAGAKVRVTFRIERSEVELGSRTSASIRIKTVLGRKFLAVTPDGTGELKGEIPLSRTSSPFDVVQAFNGLAETAGAIDTTQLARSFGTVAQTFADTPDELRTALTGLSRLSTTISSRDTQLASLLSHTRSVTKVLANRDTEFQKLVSNANLLLGEVSRRRAVIHSVLVNTTALSTQLLGLVRDNQAQLLPALQQLNAVLALLRRNQANLDRGVANLAPFVKAFANVIGNGRWFDSYIGCLIPPPPIPSAACPESGKPANPTVGGTR